MNSDIENETKITDYDELISKALKDLQGVSSILQTLTSSYSKKREFNNALKYASIRATLFPDSSEAIFDLGDIYYKNNETDKAEQFFLEVIELDPKFPRPYMRLYWIYNQKKLFDKSNEFILKARNIVGQKDKLLDYLIAFNYLSMDDYTHGFDLFRSRYDDKNTMKNVDIIANTNLLQKETDVSNKAILISHEQGFGDVINFIRFAPILKQKGAKAIYIHVLNPLWRLMQYNYGDICEVPQIGDKIDIDYHLPVMDLPYILETQANSVPYQSGYLTVAPQDSRASFKQFFLDNGKKQIAIVWRGNPDHRRDAIRSMELEVFLAHLPVEAKEANLYSLQFQPTGQEKAVLSKYGIIDLGNSLGDFYDTACIMKNIDALISVDTSVVHIGGAMNIRTFVLLSDVCDWRWSPTKLTQENNWYESVSCCRQSTRGDWESAFKQITLELNPKPTM